MEQKDTASDFNFNSAADSAQAAKAFDQKDALKNFREEFAWPKNPNTGEKQLYFAGHSLGLMPLQTRNFINEELEAWAQFGVEGHFHAQRPWLPYHENITASFAKLVGAKNEEVVAMNSLTVNLHLMMVSFYQPQGKKNKILIENSSFPSDKYAVDSQAHFHNLLPKDCIVELRPEPGKITVSPESILEQIHNLKGDLALVLLGDCNYLSGQAFEMAQITKAAQQVGAYCGFNLAHGAGNLLLNLHQDQVDFAVWCSYKYLNAGPGGIAGAFVHEKHLKNSQLKRFSGWWGHDKKSRFQMGPQFQAIPTVEAWQLSNPPIFQLASLQSSMQLFDRAGMPAIRKKGDHLTAYLEFLLTKKVGKHLQIVTPPKSASAGRGSMLSVRVNKDPQQLLNLLKQKNAIIDFREPNILRITPAPLYNSYSDVFALSEIFAEALHD